MSYKSEIEVTDLLNILLKKLLDGDYSSPNIKLHRMIQKLFLSWTSFLFWPPLYTKN